MRKSLVNVTVEKVEIAGSCNFCNRGTYNQEKRNLSYPYKAVFVLKGSQISPNVCYECSKVLREGLEVLRESLEDMENMEESMKGDE